jgi:hypothetical protein
MRLPQHGRIGVGLPANLVVFRGRRYSELLSRPQHDRVGGGWAERQMPLSSPRLPLLLGPGCLLSF